MFNLQLCPCFIANKKWQLITLLNNIILFVPKTFFRYHGISMCKYVPIYKRKFALKFKVGFDEFNFQCLGVTKRLVTLSMQRNYYLLVRIRTINFYQYCYLMLRFIIYHEFKFYPRQQPWIDSSY